MTENNAIHTKDSLEKMTFETALQALDDVVKRLESGKGSLEESMQDYEKGIALKKYCESMLQHARSRIEKITLNADGTATAQDIQLS
jgi:exodeoxyribonuclease VII small subunit